MIKWFKNLFTSTPNSISGHRKNHIPSCIRRNNSPPENSIHNNNNSQIRAIQVAAATAAAADVAVAAAQAAVAYVRVTNHRSRLTGAGDRENLAAVKIQSLFRGYLVMINKQLKFISVSLSN